MTSIIPWKPAVLASALVLSACGGGGGGGGGEAAAVDPTPTVTPAEPCTGQCANANTKLSVADVQQVIAQAVAEAKLRNVSATIAVVDRVGRVLAVVKTRDTTGVDNFATVTSSAESGPVVVGGLEGVNIIPTELAAISKAVTSAYISSEGNAFTTRTASQIVQENFNPFESNAPSGPLFGVQFSQLPCSDFSNRFDSDTGVTGRGPMRAPLGMSADPGGLPLYKAGTPVGAIGVIADGIYGLDKLITDFDPNPVDELIATAGTFGLAAPLDIRADEVTIIGKTARFADGLVEDLISAPGGAVFGEDISNADLVTVPGYHLGTAILEGTAFGQSESGIVAAPPPSSPVNRETDFVDKDGNSLDAFVFLEPDGSNDIRFISRPGSETASENFKPLTKLEVQTILNEALGVANSARAQIRQPDGSQARVSVSIVDTNGEILAIARTRDAPIFGSDVSLQKARTATFFSSTARDPLNGLAPADILRSLPAPIYLGALDLTADLIPQLAAEAADDPGQPNVRLDFPRPEMSDYIDFKPAVAGNNPLRGSAKGLQQFLFDGNPNIGADDAFSALEAGGAPVAFSDRAGGNLSRPNFPDGPGGTPSGPFSKPRDQWSIFNVGLQLDLVYNDIINHVAFVLVGAPAVVPDVAKGCTGNTGVQFPLLPEGTEPGSFTTPIKATGLGNGIQIFPGSVPIYRDNTLIGGIGVSGDGVDQDDMISFLGLHNAGLLLDGEGGIGNAPIAIRADSKLGELSAGTGSARLRYVSCPQAPFIAGNSGDPCVGL